MSTAMMAVVVSEHGGEEGESQSQQIMPLDYVVAAWLHAKTTLSHSARTQRAYGSTMARFRAYLRRFGLDLDSPDERAIADAAQMWAGLRWEAIDDAEASADVGASALIVSADPAETTATTEPETTSMPPVPAVSANTYNQRLAILSSFYVYARKRRHLRPGASNPLEMVDRRAVKAYATARPMTGSSVEERLAAIDRSTLAGLRDYALLSVAFYTGRRRFELAGLRRRHVEITTAGGTMAGTESETTPTTTAQPSVTLTYARTKGDKHRPRDLLAPGVARALLVYLRALYPEGLDHVAPDAPIWVALAPRLCVGGHARHALQPAAIRDICLKRLGTPKVHTTRHTFAVLMVKAGAPVTVIRDRLGHSSLATTSTYLAELTSDDNPYGNTLAALIGVQ